MPPADTIAGKACAVLAEASQLISSSNERDRSPERGIKHDELLESTEPSKIVGRMPQRIHVDDRCAASISMYSADYSGAINAKPKQLDRLRNETVSTGVISNNGKTVQRHRP
jgi:hypothetical protein